MAAQAERLEDLVTRVSDGLLFDERTLKPLSPRWLPPDVLRSLQKSDVGPRGAASEARTTRRTARIGVQGTSARRAAATVIVVARAGEGKERRRWVQHLTLWLERGERWRVVAFDARRQPMKEKDHKKNGGKKGRGKSGRASPKGGKR